MVSNQINLSRNPNDWKVYLNPNTNNKGFAVYKEPIIVTPTKNYSGDLQFADVYGNIFNTAEYVVEFYNYLAFDMWDAIGVGQTQTLLELGETLDNLGYKPHPTAPKFLTLKEGVMNPFPQPEGLSNIPENASTGFMSLTDLPLDFRANKRPLVDLQGAYYTWGVESGTRITVTNSIINLVIADINNLLNIETFKDSPVGYSKSIPIIGLNQPITIRTYSIGSSATKNYAVNIIYAKVVPKITETTEVI